MRRILPFLTALTLMTGRAQAMPSSVEQIVKANSQFASDVYHKLQGRKGSFCFSPFVLSSALGMTFEGAKGSTLAEVGKVMHAEGLAVHSSLGWLLTEMSQRAPGYQLDLANGMWTEKRVVLDKFFADMIQDAFHTTLMSTDFHDPGVRPAVDAWISKKTHDKVQGLTPPAPLNPDTRILLASGLYVKASWKTKFDPRTTVDAPFTTVSGKSVTSKMMEVTGQFRYAQVAAAQVLELPYAGRLALDVVLPEKASALPKLESSIDESHLKTWLAGGKTLTVKVDLPRFRTATTLNLGDALQALGLKQSFKAGQADFSTIGGGAGELAISTVIHKTVFQVSESGTEPPGKNAPAAPPPVPSSQAFRADHAFLYVVRDRPTGTILIIGRLDSPNS